MLNRGKLISSALALSSSTPRPAQGCRSDLGQLIPAGFGRSKGTHIIQNRCPHDDPLVAMIQEWALPENDKVAL